MVKFLNKWLDLFGTWNEWKKVPKIFCIREKKRWIHFFRAGHKFTELAQSHVTLQRYRTQNFDTPVFFCLSVNWRWFIVCFWATWHRVNRFSNVIDWKTLTKLQNWCRLFYSRWWWDIESKIRCQNNSVGNWTRHANIAWLRAREKKTCSTF